MDIVTYLRNLASPDPYDERPVMHSKELYAAANEITTLRAKVEELTQDVLVRNNLMSQDHKLVVSLREQLAAMMQERDKVFAELCAMTQERDELVKVFAKGLDSELVAAERRIRYEQLTASQAREQQLREALEFVRYNTGDNSYANMRATKALALPSDNSALIRSNKLYAAGVLSKAIDEIDPTWEGLEVLRSMAAQLRKEAGE